MSRIIESFLEFRTRQGCDFIVTGTQISPRTGEDLSRICFSNGATSDGNQVHHEPPIDPRQLASVKCEYVTARIKREIAEFTQYRDACLEQAAMASRYANLPPAPPEAPELLRAGAERIHKLRAELATLNDLL